MRQDARRCADARRRASARAGASTEGGRRVNAGRCADARRRASTRVGASTEGRGATTRFCASTCDPTASTQDSALTQAPARQRDGRGSLTSGGPARSGVAATVSPGVSRAPPLSSRLSGPRTDPARGTPRTRLTGPHGTRHSAQRTPTGLGLASEVRGARLTPWSLARSPPAPDPCSHRIAPGPPDYRTRRESVQTTV